MDPAVSTVRSDAAAGSVARWRQVASAIGCLILGLVLLVAAWSKTLHPDAFADQIRLEGLDFLLPAGVVALIALALEYFLGMALVLLVRHRALLAVTGALVAFFVFLTGRAYWRATQGILPDDASCGCFGNLLERTPAEAFWQDLFLMVPPLLLAFLAVRVGRAPMRRLVLAALVTVGMTFVAWRAPELPLDELATPLRPGASIEDLCAGADDPEAGTQRVCLADLVPEALLGEHLIVLADLNEEFAARSTELDDYVLASFTGPQLWVLTGATEEELFQYRFSQGPAYELREAPAPLLRRLYRRPPRSFTVLDGEVTQTWAGLEPLAANFFEE